jgi:hypothetical protein
MGEKRPAVVWVCVSLGGYAYRVAMSALMMGTSVGLALLRKGWVAAYVRIRRLDNLVVVVEVSLV